MKLAPAVPLVCLALLSGCGGGQSNASADQQQYNDYRTQGADTTPGGGLSLTLGGGGNSSSASQATNGLGVNAYLWRGSLDTLSFMPLLSADPFGGVIITDWYTPAGVGGERFKATVYILGRELRSDGLKVSIFRQVQSGGAWLDTAVAPATSSEIEDKILARARELRAAANGSAG